MDILKELEIFLLEALESNRSTIETLESVCINDAGNKLATSLTAGFEPADLRSEASVSKSRSADLKSLEVENLPTFKSNGVFANIYEDRSTSFSAADLELLTRVVACRGHANWGMIARELGGAFSQDFLARRWKCEQPGVKSGRWSSEEDALLVKLVRVFGSGRWSEVSSYIAGRSDVKCRDRWEDVLKVSYGQFPN